MSKYNQYARKLDTMAKAHFQKYKKLNEEYNKAQEDRRQYPLNTHVSDPEFVAKAARANADYLTAQNDLHKMRLYVQNDLKAEIAALRRELETVVAEDYSADPAKIDSNTLELLKSGLLKPAEYERLMTKAQAAGNHTMYRLIGKYAGDRAEADSSKTEVSHPGIRAEVVRLRMIARQGEEHTGENYLKAFDSIANAFVMFSDNPGAMDRWEEVTGATVEDF